MWSVDGGAVPIALTIARYVLRSSTMIKMSRAVSFAVALTFGAPLLLPACSVRPARCYGGRSKGGIWYSDIPSPNTTVFGVLWPPRIALWGFLVLSYSLVVR